MSKVSGLNNTACSLAPSGSGLPLPGLLTDLATEPLAKLWSGGTLSVWDHPLGNFIEFHGSYSNSNDLRLIWHDYISCLHRIRWTKWIHCVFVQATHFRWFEACSCKPASRGPLSSFVQLRTLFIKVRSWRTMIRVSISLIFGFNWR